MNAVMKEMVDQRKEGGMVEGEEAGDEVSIIISIQGHLLNQVFHCHLKILEDLLLDHVCQMGLAVSVLAGADYLL
jgi:hypothetical protein